MTPLRRNAHHQSVNLRRQVPPWLRRANRGERLHGLCEVWEFVENQVHPDRGNWVKCSICDWHKVYAAGQHKDIKLRLISSREDALHSLVLQTPAAWSSNCLRPARSSQWAHTTSADRPLHRFRARPPPTVTSRIRMALPASVDRGLHVLPSVPALRLPVPIDASASKGPTPVPPPHSRRRVREGMRVPRSHRSMTVSGAQETTAQAVRECVFWVRGNCVPPPSPRPLPPTQYTNPACTSPPSPPHPIPSPATPRGVLRGKPPSGGVTCPGSTCLAPFNTPRLVQEVPRCLSCNRGRC
jgi:hypothetical protein